MLTGAHIFSQLLTDRCYIDTRFAGNEWGSTRSDITYTAGTTEKKCRVVSHKAIEIPDKSKMIYYDTDIYMKRADQPAEDSRIRVTKLYNETQGSPLTYAIVGVEIMPAGIKVLCRQAKGNTAE